MAVETQPNVFHIPAGAPFLRVLAQALLDGDLPRLGGGPPDRLALADIELLLPTRRAVRALQEAFLDVSGGRAMILPRVRPISDVDDDLGLIAGLIREGADLATARDIPEAISEMERRLALTKLVLAWAEARRDPAVLLDPVSAAGARTPAQAALLAADLARFMDAVETEGVDLSALPGLVETEFAQHWQQTLAFLTVVTEHWPRHLEERGLISPSERRNLSIRAEAERLRQSPPATPVIVAGVTGSVPATAELMAAVAALPRGALVLPNLDTFVDEETWEAIGRTHPEHPQSGLKRLLGELGVARAHVQALPDEPQGGQRARQRLLGEAMRPAETTERWHSLADQLDGRAVAAGLAGISLIEAPTPQDEAEVVALILREAAEVPGRTAALVSPDRVLARRVATRLEAWGIRVDDSAGRPFAKTVPGAFLDLVLTAASASFPPRETMALLKHPLARLGLSPGDVRRAARALELIVFRAPYIGHGLAGIEAAYEAASFARASGARLPAAATRLAAEAWDAARDLIGRLREACGPLAEALAEAVPTSLAELARQHMACAEALAQPGDDAASPLWEGEAGETAALLFSGLMDESLPTPPVGGPDYPDFYRSLIAGTNVRQRIPVHPRLSIWGPFEARLQRPDVVILGSLNEGTWPEAADPGPWLNRPMLAKLGMPAPEEHIGFAAHDFTALMCADRVYMTRALKSDGAPTVASRWLMRLQALLGGLDAAGVLQPDKPWLAWAAERDSIAELVHIEQPAPRPAITARPRQLSVTAIERWIANPYAIFAQYVLRLEKLAALGNAPGPDQRGAIVHEAMRRFTELHPSTLPDDIEGALVAIAKDILDRRLAHPRIAAFWLPRFERFAHWFAETEADRRKGAELVRAEVGGKDVIPAPAGPFFLTARADRLDIGANGVVITDYKTGSPPANSAVVSGASPQLPLEAAMVIASAFDGLETNAVAGLRYIRAHGGEPAGEQRDITGVDFSELAQAARGGLERLVEQFDDPGTPYRAVRRSGFDYRYDDYAHLARVEEWGLGEADEGSDDG